MSSNLSIFAARLRDFIAISSSEELYLQPSDDPALLSHLDVEFNGMALVLFGLQFAENPVYRRICEARGIHPRTVNHWTQVPALSTTVFKECDVTCLTPEERTAVFHSSGTTEQRPSRHHHSRESLELYEASLWPWFAHALNPRRPEVRLVALTPRGSAAPHSSLVHMFETIGAKMNCGAAMFLGGVDADGAWTVDVDRTTGELEASARSNTPMLILGTAFSFVHLLDALAERRLQFALPAGSTVMETGGYKGRSRSMPKSDLHSLISERMGVARERIVCEYGMSELSSQAYSIADGVFRFPPWARAQVVSLETGQEVADGEAGVLRIVDLANAFSVMAIDTEDRAIRRGDGFELIGRVEASEPRGCSLMPAPFPTRL